MIPFGDLARTYRRLRGEIDEAVAEVLSSGWFILGRQVEAFETELALALGARYAVGVGNGTDAIALALTAAGVGPGDEVVTSPLSAAFTALAISQIGAVPVFADIDPRRYTLDPERVEAALSPRTRALLPVHLYGQPADLAPLVELARDRGLALVEDCAQCHGATYRGQPAGTFGQLAAWSFYPSKNLGAFGDGGAVTTDDPALAERLRLLRNGGQPARYRHEILGVNSRLDELQAAILRVRLRHLPADNARRRAIAGRYTAALPAGAPLVGPWVAADVEPAWHLYVVRAPDRDALAARLAADGVETLVHYPTPVHLQPAYGGPARRGELPSAERAADEVLSLPNFPELTDPEVDTVARALAGAAQPA
jgi:dTDP-4-amino-4,6-dideoxygalactose transaminase